LAILRNIASVDFAAQDEKALSEALAKMKLNRKVGNEMGIFRNPGFNWVGGNWYDMMELYNGLPLYDFYIPVKRDAIRMFLEPVSAIIKKNTYISNKASVAGLLAKYFVDAERPVRARYFEKFQKLQGYARTIADIPFKFENHLDGKGIKIMFQDAEICPEQKIWWHIKYILTQRPKMVSAEAALKWMSFDKASRINLNLEPMTIEQIEERAQEFLQSGAGQSPTYRPSYSRPQSKPQSRYISEYEHDSGKEEDDVGTAEKEDEEEVKRSERPQQPFG
jgi:hypothetical protein